jgi:hypothetical protein
MPHGNFSDIAGTAIFVAGLVHIFAPHVLFSEIGPLAAAYPGGSPTAQAEGFLRMMGCALCCTPRPLVPSSVQQRVCVFRGSLASPPYLEQHDQARVSPRQSVQACSPVEAVCVPRWTPPHLRRSYNCEFLFACGAGVVVRVRASGFLLTIGFMLITVRWNPANGPMSAAGLIGAYVPSPLLSDGSPLLLQGVLTCLGWSQQSMG